MSTTVGHIRGIVTLDTAGYKAQSKDVRADAKQLKRDVEAQKPKLDADPKPFVEAVAKAEAAQAALNVKASSAAKSLLGMALAGGAAGTIMAGSLTAVPLVLAAIAAAALSTDEEVRDAFSDLGSEAKSTIKEISAPLRDELAAAAGQATTGLRLLRPVLKRAAEEGGPSVSLMADGLVRLAVNLGPGLLAAARESAPAMAGVNALLDRTGRGLSKFLIEASTEAPAAGRAIGDLGRLVEDLLGSGGELSAMLAREGAGPWAQFVNVVDQTTDSALDLGENALPSVASGASSVLSVVSNLLGVLGPLAPVLGTALGIMMSYKVGAAVMGTAGDALGRLGGRMDSASVGGTKLTGATRGLGNALGAIGPYGAAAGGALLALLAVTDQLHGSTDKLASALMAGGNAADQASTKLKQNASDAMLLQTTGGGLSSLYATLFIPTMEDAQEAVSEQRASMTTLQRAHVDATAAAANHSQAVEKYGPKSREAAAASADLTHAQQVLKDAQHEAADATKTATDRLIEQHDAAFGLASSGLRLRSAQTELSAAQQQLTDLQKTGTATTLELERANETVESRMLGVVEASRLAALAHFENKESVEAQTSAISASNAKALELAASTSGPLPAALADMVLNMDDSALSAIGATRAINSTNDAVINLKDGKVIKIEAKDMASPVINDLNAKELRSKILYIDLVTRAESKVAADALTGGMNAGGWIPGGGPDVDSKLTPTTPGEFVVTRKAAAKYGPLLEAINRSAGGDVKMPDHPMLANMPMPRIPAAGMALSGAGSYAGGGTSLSGGTQSSRTTNVHVTMHSIKALPTVKELENIMHDAEVMYG